MTSSYTLYNIEIITLILILKKRRIKNIGTQLMYVKFVV